jgi:predicted small metal-binding protein
MKEFRCNDVVPGCPYVTRSDQEEELFEQISSHAREAHGMDEVPPEVADTIRSVIVEV